jgi:soluble lytic murein transglycosylase
MTSAAASEQRTVRRIEGARSTACCTAILAVLVALPVGARQTATFRQEWLRPYLGQGAGAEGRRQLQANAPRKAAVVLRRAARRGQEQLQARFLLGQALLSGKPTTAELREAATIFGALANDYALLSDYCRFYAARAQFKLRNFTEAEALAAAIPAGAVLRAEAQILRADALQALQREAEGAAIWRDYLRAGGGKQAGRAHYRIAAALEIDAANGAATAATMLEALDHYKQVVIQAPLSKLRPDAEKRLAALARLIPDGARRAALTYAQRLEQGQSYFNAQRNKEAEAIFASLAKERNLKPDLRCKATFLWAKSIFKQRQRGRAVASYDAAAAACRKASQSELVVKSLHDAGRGLLSSKQHLEGIRRFEVIVKEFPQHSYADDALLWEAEAYEALKRRADVERALSSLPERYPRGDMAHEALWRLARMYYLEKRYPEAIAVLDRSMRELGRPRYYYSVGQAQYWKARILEQTTRSAEARALYERCIRDYPLSYYALLAFNRLRERHGPHFARLQAELINPVGRERGRWSFAPSALFTRAGFLRGVELARLGLGAESARELALVGLDASGATGGDVWLAAVLYDRAGLWHLSHRVPRRAEGYKRTYPLGEDYRRWALAYPQAFLQLVRPAAKRAQIPEALAWSVMREESGFSTTVESYANAIGLMQLILPTARTAGRQLKLQVTRELLCDPAVNIKLGTTFLGFLERAMSQTLPLAIGGYNAGEGAVYKWLRQTGRVPLDEFIERIPYDQTRRYTKRVLSSIFTYSVLYGSGAARIPRISQSLPRIKARAFGK